MPEGARRLRRRATEFRIPVSHQRLRNRPGGIREVVSSRGRWVPSTFLASFFLPVDPRGCELHPTAAVEKPSRRPDPERNSSVSGCTCSYCSYLFVGARCLDKCIQPSSNITMFLARAKYSVSPSLKVTPPSSSIYFSCAPECSCKALTRICRMKTMDLKVSCSVDPRNPGKKHLKMEIPGLCNEEMEPLGPRLPALQSGPHGRRSPTECFEPSATRRSSRGSRVPQSFKVVQSFVSSGIQGFLIREHATRGSTSHHEKLDLLIECLGTRRATCLRNPPAQTSRS